jgi:hypothetical protein
MMRMSGQDQPEEQLFFEALSRQDAATRRVFLERTCAGNADLRRRIEALLAVQADADRFFADAASRPRMAPASEDELHSVANRTLSNP